MVDLRRPSGWSVATLGAVVRLQRGHDLPAPQRAVGSVPVIGSGGPTGWHSEPKAQGPGVIIGRAANLGRPYFVEGPYWPLNTTLYVTDFLDHDPRFVYYLFQTLDLTGYNSGSVQPMLNRNYVKNVPISLPPLSEQRQIGRLLGSLDRKVTSNARLSRVATALPASLLQLASQNAATVSLGNVAEVRKGLSYKGAGLSNSGMPMVNLANAAAFGGFKRTGWKHYTGDYKPRHVTRGGELLVANTEQTWRNEILGWPILVPDDVDEALFSQDISIIDFRPAWRHVRLSTWAHLFTTEARQRVDGMAYGTTVARFPPEALTGLEVPVLEASDPVLEQAEALLARAWAAERESDALAKLRDALLPALMSGQLRVREAEELVGEAV